MILSQDTGSRTIIHCNRDYPQTTWEDFSKIDLSQYGWVHFEARNTTHVLKMMQSIREHSQKTGQRIIISLDFETRYDQNLELCAPCDYVIFSKELAAEKGWTTPRQTCEGLAGDLPDNLNPKPAIICPWGSDGAVCLDSSGNYHKLSPYQPEKVVDTLGAGDSFVAGFIKATFEDQRSLREAVDDANRIASCKIEGHGYDHIK